jgi:hypothetical protein
MPEPKNAPSPVEVSISRMTNPDCIRIRVEIAREMIDVEMSLEDFALTLTGRGSSPGKLLRRLTRPAPADQAELVLAQGQQLMTKDGRVRTNAIVVHVVIDEDTSGKVTTWYAVGSDFGNTMRMDAKEIHENYYTVGREGVPIIHDVAQWHSDRRFNCA